MGKDRSKEENATTSSATENKDHSQDQESRDAVLARTIAVAVAGALTQQKAQETQSITEAVAQQTKSITETLQRHMEKTHAQYEELLKASRAQNFPSTLKLLPAQKASE